MARTKSKRKVHKGYTGYHAGMGINLGQEMHKEAEKWKTRIPAKKKRERGTQLGNAVFY